MVTQEQQNPSPHIFGVFVCLCAATPKSTQTQMNARARTRTRTHTAHKLTVTVLLSQQNTLFPSLTGYGYHIEMNGSDIIK